MKTLKWTLLLAAIFFLPVLLMKKMRRVPVDNAENIRYDIDDYTVDQEL